MSQFIDRPRSINTVFLDQPPSCLEFCPTAPDYFLIGTYLLSEQKQEGTDDDIVNTQQIKTGSLQLWNLNPASCELSLIQRVSVEHAVFDLHFHPRHAHLVAIASSDGSVSLFNVSSSPANVTSVQHPVQITHLWTLPVHGDDNPTPIPALFLSWAPAHWFANPEMDGFAVTFSDARTKIFGSRSGFEDKQALVELDDFVAKQNSEVWFVAMAAFSEKEGGISEDGRGGREYLAYLFTGNDFGTVSTRQFAVIPGENRKDDDNDDGGGAAVLPLIIDYDDRSRHHTAGVTALLPLPVPLVDGAPLLLTGSYDEMLRVYHVTRKGRVLAETSLGGGVWRVQLLNSKTLCRTEENGMTHSEWTFLVLASCMHAGTRVVRVTCRRNGTNDLRIDLDEDVWIVDVLAEFTEHESMNYAAGIWRGRYKDHDGSDAAPSNEQETLCVSSSFYDRRVCVWKTNVG